MLLSPPLGIDPSVSAGGEVTFGPDMDTGADLTLDTTTYGFKGAFFDVTGDVRLTAMRMKFSQAGVVVRGVVLEVDTSGVVQAVAGDVEITATGGSGYPPSTVSFAGLAGGGVLLAAGRRYALGFTRYGTASPSHNLYIFRMTDAVFAAGYADPGGRMALVPGSRARASSDPVVGASLANASAGIWIPGITYSYGSGAGA
jgi:hypothetical protein